MHLIHRHLLVTKQRNLFYTALLFTAGCCLFSIGPRDSLAVQVPSQRVTAVTGDVAPASKKLDTLLTSLPLSFEENQGQFTHETDFLARGPGYSLFLSADDVTLRLQHVVSSTDTHGEGGASFSEVVRMHLLNADPDAEGAGLEVLPGKVNYFIGNNSSRYITDIPTHARVRYTNVYQGINVEYYGYQRQLEYDFVVTPGSNPDQIRMEFTGVESVEIGKSGDLLLHTVDGTLRQQAPFSYQEIDGVRHRVESSFVFRNDSESSNGNGRNIIGFQLASYDTDKPLMIDPILSYSTYLGGSSSDTAYGAATDSAGDIYLTGYTSSYIDFPTVNPYQENASANYDIFISKISADGSTLLYSTYLGASSYDYGYGIAVDSSGAAYVTGVTGSTDFPVTLDGVQTVYGGGSYDAFVVKLSAAGNSLEYATYLGGAGADYGKSIAVDSSGQAFVAGHTPSTDFPVLNALYSSYQGGTQDAFVTQLSADGKSLVYSTYLGGDSEDIAYGIAIDSAGNAYVTGTAYSDFPVTPGAYVGTNTGVFVSKIAAGGASLLYSTCFGGNSMDYAYGIAVDGTGRACITGKTFSSDYPIVGEYQNDTGGNDAFLTQISADGSGLLYSTYLGGSLEDIGYALTIDSSGIVYVTGSTKSTDFPVKQATFEGSSYGGGDTDGFVARFDLSTTGENSLIYSLFLGGNAADTGRAIVSPAPGVCYVAGDTRSADFPLITPLQSTIGANGYGAYNSNNFLAKISDDQSYADIFVTIEDSPDPVAIGADYSYQILVHNRSNAETATGVVFTNTLPAEVTFVSSSATQGTPVHASGIVTLDAGSIAPLGDVVLTVTVTAPGADTILSNTVNVTSSSADSNSLDNTYTEETKVRSQYYSVAVSNYDYSDNNAPSCGTVISTPAGINCGGGVCNADFLEETVLKLTATFPAECAFMGWTGGDGYEVCGVSSVDCYATVASGTWAMAKFSLINADLELTSEDHPDISMVSGAVEYGLTIKNVGTHTAENVVLVDTLPANAVYVSSTTSSGSCTYDGSAHTVTCDASSLLSSRQIDLSITVTAPASATTMTNQAVVSSDTIDLDSNNNSITELTIVTDQERTLTVLKASDGTGTVTSDMPGIDCGVDCTATYPMGTIITLQALPERGSFFTGWSGDGCSGMGSCVVPVDTDKTVTATFTTSTPAIIALPKTGQTTCFNDAGVVIDCTGTGQDGELQRGLDWPDPRFELIYCDITGPCAEQTADCDADSSTDMITDHLTGLVWSRNTDLTPNYVNWQVALDTVSDLNTAGGIGGYTDWRLPNINEIASVTMHQKGGAYNYTWLEAQGFTFAAEYPTVWTSTSVESGTLFAVAYTGNLQNGGIYNSYKSNINGVWAVRGSSNSSTPVWKTGQSSCTNLAGEQIDCAGSGQDGEIQAGIDLPNPRFSTIYCDSTGECADQSVDCDGNANTDMVRDNLTGLIFTRDTHLMSTAGNLQAARDALAVVNSGAGLGGYTDWRLPNMLELQSLVDVSQTAPALPAGHPFVNASFNNMYWLSTTADYTHCASGTCANMAYVASMGQGITFMYDKVTSYQYLWPVRDDTGSADVTVSVEESSDPVKVNSTLVYTVTVSNLGPGNATDVNLENTLAAAVGFVSASSSQGTCTESAGVVSCTLGEIAGHDSATVTIETSVGATLETLSNSAVVTASSHDPNTGNNSVVDTTRVSDIDYTLTVIAGGNGVGTISSSPAGIDCGSNCSSVFFETTLVTLNAVVADGSTLFMGWEGCDQVSGTECTVAMDSTRTVTAFFDAVTNADYYVSPAGDDTYNGLGWSRAFKTIEKAISVAQSGEEIWVKAGTYLPPVSWGDSAFYAIYKKISLYGGFAGSETAVSQRDWETNVTQVDASPRTTGNGQGFYIKTDGDTGPGTRVRIDGFMIRGGWAMGANYPTDTGGAVIVQAGSPLIANCDIQFNSADTSGGGIAAGSGTTIVNCRIHHNNSRNFGGGIQGNSGVRVINSAVYSNYSTYSGAGIAFWSGGTVENTTVAGNTIATGNSGVAAGVDGYYNGTTTVTNSIIWGNFQGENPSELATASGASINVTYSNIRGGYTGTGNVDSDPGFNDLLTGDLRVQPYSAGIDTGNSGAVPADIADLDNDGNTSEDQPVDIVLNSRVVSTVDMGAYEYIPGLYAEYALSVTVLPSGTAVVSGPGMACADNCSTVYFAGSGITLTAFPQSPYRFAYWEGCDSSNWDECNVVMDSARSVVSHLVDETADSDADSMLDWWEYLYFGSLSRDGAGDYDSDGLIDSDEFSLSTLPDDSDTDNDGMPDGWEVANNLNPLINDADLDPDGDGLSNLTEYEDGTDPQQPDLDGFPWIMFMPAITGMGGQ